MKYPTRKNYTAADRALMFDRRRRVDVGIKAELPDLVTAQSQTPAALARHLR